MSILGKAVHPKSTVPVKMWLYGAPDSGKTHLAVSGPNPIILSTDGNYVYFPHVPANSLTDWEVGPLAKDEEKATALVNLVNELKKANPFETVVLDLAEGALRLARDHVVKKTYKVSHEQEVGQWGKGYQIIRENYISTIEQIFKLPVNVIIISHEAKETIKPKNGPEYTVFKPNLDEKFHEVLEGYCNIVARVYKDVDKDGGEVRKISLSPKEHEYGINRLGKAEDLILEHNGDVWGDFYKIYHDLYEQRGLNMREVIKNTTRENAEKDKKERKAEDKKQEIASKIKAIEVKKAEETANVETKNDDIVEDTTKEEVKQETTAEKIARLKAEKEAELKVEKVAVEETTTPVQKETVVSTKADVEEDSIDDGEPEIERTESVNEKLARIAQLKKKALDDNKKRLDKENK